jgi:signal transduction histidine kinase
VLVGPDSRLSLSARLGGRWLISRTGFIIFVAGLTLSVFVGEPSATATAGGAAAWFLLTVAAACAFGGYLIVLDRIEPFRSRRTAPVPLWLVLVATAAGTAGIGLVYGLGAALIDLPAAQGLLVRVLGLMCIGGAIGLGLILLLDELDRVRRTRQALIERRVSAELATLQQQVLIQELRNELRRSVDGELTDMRADLSGRLALVETSVTARDLAPVAESLRLVAVESVRELSARLWTEAAQVYPRTRLRRVVVNTVRHEPFQPLALVVLHVVGSVPSNVSVFGGAVAATMIAISALLIFGVCAAANALMRRRTASHARIFIGGIIALEIFVIPAAIWRDQQVPGSGSVTWVVTQIVAGVIVILLTSGIGSWQHLRDALDRSFLADLDHGQVQAVARSRAVADVARDLSRHLHGTLQTRLVACAMVSERAVESGDVEQMKEALGEAQRVLGSEVREQPPSQGVREEVLQRVALWEELCEVTVRVAPDVDGFAQDADQSERVGRIVEEGLANAIRHGDAERILVAIAVADGGALVVVVEDDGDGPADSSPGLGTAFLDEATHGNWTLTRTDDGARLEARVPAPAVSQATTPIS